MAALTTCLMFVIASQYNINDNKFNVDDQEENDEERNAVFAPRSHCQITYVLGVEGSMHHGFAPVLEALAKQQIDTSTGTPYDVTYASKPLRSALLGFGKQARSLDNTSLIRQTIRQICPPNGIKHVIIEDTSFPSGSYDDPRSYRIHRQRWWLTSNMEQIAMSEVAMNHPTNLNVFYDGYSVRKNRPKQTESCSTQFLSSFPYPSFSFSFSKPYADIKFIVLARPYIDTISSLHSRLSDLDNNVQQHSTVIRGFMLLLRRFLDSHPIDATNGQRLWTLVCSQRLTNKYYGDDINAMDHARQRILSHLSHFLGWENVDCIECFSTWKDSTKNHEEIMGEMNVESLIQDVEELSGIWPPTVENPLPEQQCTL